MRKPIVQKSDTSEGALRFISEQVAEPVSTTAFASVLIFASVAGSIEWLPGNLATADGTGSMQCGNYLPPVSGLNSMKPGNAIGNVFDMPAGDVFSCHLFEAEGNAGNAKPI